MRSSILVSLVTFVLATINDENLRLKKANEELKKTLRLMSAEEVQVAGDCMFDYDSKGDCNGAGCFWLDDAEMCIDTEDCSSLSEADCDSTQCEISSGKCIKKGTGISLLDQGCMRAHDLDLSNGVLNFKCETPGSDKVNGHKCCAWFPDNKLHGCKVTGFFEVNKEGFSADVKTARYQQMNDYCSISMQRTKVTLTVTNPWEEASTYCMMQCAVGDLITMPNA